MRHLIPSSFVPGVEVAGTVAAVGVGVDPTIIGQSVFARVQAGAYADQVAVSSTAIVHLPNGCGFQMAVASGINALVAYFCLSRAQVVAEEYVMVRGALGGIGHLAVQMASNLGARIVDARQAPLSSVDVTIDLVAGPETGRYIDNLNANGRYVIAGITAGVPPEDFASTLVTDFRRSRTLATLSLDTVSNADLNRAAEKIFANVAAGKIAPIVARTLPLAEAELAHQILSNGGVRGKIVLVP